MLMLELNAYTSHFHLPLLWLEWREFGGISERILRTGGTYGRSRV
jgi:hypothetical protein